MFQGSMPPTPRGCAKRTHGGGGHGTLSSPPPPCGVDAGACVCACVLCSVCFCARVHVPPPCGVDAGASVCVCVCVEKCMRIQ